MRRWIAAVLLDAVIFYMAVLYGSSGAVMIAIAVLIWLGVTVCYVNVVAFGIQTKVQVPIALAEKGQAVGVFTMVKRETGTGKLRIGVQLLTEPVSAANGKKKRTRIRFFEAADKRGMQKTRHEIVFWEAGMYEISLERIRVYDMTGLFYVERRVRKQTAQTIEVLPEITETSVRLTEPVRNFFGEAEVYDTLRPGHDVNDVFQIRPFQDGDKIQSIHWKLSVRTDELMVKENGHPKACPVVLLLDAEMRVDAFYTAAASLSFALFDAGCPHYTAWYSGRYKDIVRFRVDDEESFYEFLACYLAEKECRCEDSIQKLYKEKYKSELLLHDIRLNGTLEIFMDDKKLTQIPKDNVNGALAGMELIL